MKYPTAVRRLARAAFVSALAAPLWANGVRILERPALATFDTLQSAVDAAFDGETLLVGGGAYASVTIDGKALALVAMEGQMPAVDGTVSIKNLTIDEVVTLVGIQVTSITPPSTNAPPATPHALVIDNCTGHVHLQNCTMLGGDGALSNASTDPQHGAGGTAIRVIQSQRVSLVRCMIVGGDGGASAFLHNYETRGGAGGRGLDSSSSRISIYDCALFGGKGGQAGYSGGDGGDACHVSGLYVIVSNSSFKGADGGLAWDYLGDEGGAGGDCIEVAASTQAHVLDCSFDAGYGGQSLTSGNYAPDGQDFAGSGTTVQHAGTARRLSASAVTPEQSLWNVTVTGEPGDLVQIAYSSVPAFGPATPATGVSLVPVSAPVFRSAQVTLPMSGTATLPVRIGRIGGDASDFLFLQGWVLDASNQFWFASPLHLLVLNRDALPDCNANTKLDVVDILTGVETDLDDNLTPDSCDPDCNGNGAADGYDLLSAASHDCDGNAIPDECDIAGGASLDCNGNGFPDTCDLASGASSDANANAVPDECEPNGTWYVDDSALPGGNGSSAAPFQALGQAFAAAISGDSIVLRDGTYTGASNRELDFDGRVLVVESENGAANCVIDCQGQGRAFRCDSGEGAGTMLQAVTIRNGWTSGFGYGGALYVANASPTVRDCVFEQCQSYFGGALYLSSSSSRVEGCTLRNNSSLLADPNIGVGGGALVASGTVSFERCSFEGNQARYGGGGLAWQQYYEVGPSESLLVSHCRFISNYAYGTGGGFQCRSFVNHVGYVDDCLFAGNVAGTDGGGIWSEPTGGGGSHLTLVVTNTTIVDNSAQRGGGYFASIGADTKLINSILWQNQAPLGPQIATNCYTSIYFPEGVKVEYTDLQGGAAAVYQLSGVFTYGGGNVNAAPSFVDADGADDDPLTCGDNDYRIGVGSPCIDAGRNGIVQTDLVDIDGDGDFAEKVPLDLGLAPRRTDDTAVPDTGLGNAPLVDLGCFERQP